MGPQVHTAATYEAETGAVWTNELGAGWSLGLYGPLAYTLAATLLCSVITSLKLS